MPDADPLVRATLADDLLRSAGLWQRIDVVASTGSTNADLAAAARDGAPSGTVLVADHQSAGRGRLGRTWTAPPGSGAAISVLLRPEVPLDRWTWLPLLAGLAVSDALRQSTGLPADVKWPNDVLVLDRKLCGVLAERVDTADGAAVVLGMGVNVHLRADELPVPTATSVDLARAELGVAGVPVSRTAVVSSVLRCLERDVRRWEEVSAVAEGDPDAVAVAYRERCSTLGREVRVTLSDGSVLEGTARDVDAYGRLLLETEAGTQVLGAGDVVHLR
ncbi:biotin--[acetyl-CoA-carboxylase] ligase [Microlunatus flavus]|uniref:biotin--[biotin carboxyl-carrier protein] ligase n=1 Tax=Microlunatus flavus TaxID=1036181 RepID=A0A1H9CE13_9ACTN|nr:biotin--[acetyl-CoA-carboxylase] ligase [Microlunatus flavus]SEP99399.1 BirA family transcriptional regulator, biotin operon repressor / biotin-[acetyl-CoA-carboxylase] ligase [Microlunatus flavus]